MLQLKAILKAEQLVWSSDAVPDYFSLDPDPALCELSQQESLL
jgi:hypothetical protein